jgi:photosystem II stability/assembly factor-like uncharacterized protein
MRLQRKYLLIIFLAMLMMNSRCKDNRTGPNDSESEPELGRWQLLGLKGKLVSNLVFIGDYLYATAGRDGLYRLNRFASNTNWEYIGLADTNIERTLESGVTDVVSVDGNLLVSYVASERLQKHGIYRSMDNGLTWLPSDNGMSSIPEYSTTSQVINLEKHPYKEKVVFAVTSVNLIYMSEDGGNSWRRVYGFPASSLNYVLKVNENFPNEIWVGGETGRFAPYLLHSMDSGLNWRYITFPPNFGPYTYDNAVYDIAIDPKNDSVLYFGMLGVIGKTTNKGETFQRILGWEDGIYRHWRLAINPMNPQEIFATGRYLYRTTDGGQSWQKIPPPDNRNELYALAVDWQRRVLYVSTSSPGNGIYKLYF